MSGPAATDVAPAAPVARIVGYVFTPAPPRVFDFTRRLGGAPGAAQPGQGIVEVSLDFVSEHERYGYAGLFILARAMNGGEPASLTAYDLPPLTTQPRGSVTRRISLDVADPSGTFSASRRVETSNRIDGVQLTVLGLRQADASSPAPPFEHILTDPLRHLAYLDVLDDRLVAVDYRLRVTFEGSK